MRRPGIEGYSPQRTQRKTRRFSSVISVFSVVALLLALAAPAAAGSGGRHGHGADASPADLACQAEVDPRAMAEATYRAWVAGVVEDATAAVIAREQAPGLIDVLNFAAPEVAALTEAFIRFDAPSRPGTSLVVAVGKGCALGDGVFDRAAIDELLSQ